MRANFLDVRKGDNDVKRERVNDNERILEGVSIAKALWQLHSGKAILGSLDGSIDRLLVVFCFFCGHGISVMEWNQLHSKR